MTTRQQRTDAKAWETQDTNNTNNPQKKPLYKNALSLLLTGKIRIGVIEMAGLKCVHKRWNSCYLKVVYNKKKMPFAYTEFTTHMRNQLWASSIGETKLWLSHDVPLFSYAWANHISGSLSRRNISILFEQAIRRFSKWIWVVLCNL